jgi:hypothetical protein
MGEAAFSLQLSATARAERILFWASEPVLKSALKLMADS